MTTRREGRIIWARQINWREKDLDELQEAKELRLEIFREVCLRPEMVGMEAYKTLKELDEKYLSELRNYLQGITELKEALREHILVMFCEGEELTEDGLREVEAYLAEITLAELETIEVAELRKHLFRRLCAAQNLNRNEQAATMEFLEKLDRKKLVIFEEYFLKEETTAVAEVYEEEPDEEAPSGETDGESGEQQVKKVDPYEERITHMIQERVFEQRSSENLEPVVWKEVDPDAQTENMHEVKIDSKEE